MPSLDEILQKDLLKRQQQALYRQRKIIDIPDPEKSSVYVNIRGNSLLSFCSNDYLGLAGHPEIAQQLKQGINEYGVGSGSAHLVSGHSRAHHELEEILAEYTGRSRALLFSTGYMANLGIVNALMGKGDIVFQDKLNHASLIDAALLSTAFSGSLLKRYPHNNTKRLAQLLITAEGFFPREPAEGSLSSKTAEGSLPSKTAEGSLLSKTAEGSKPGSTARKLVMSDAVFSMDGDVAEVAQLAELCQQQDAWFMLDDAHGFGVLGKQGAGVAEEYVLDQQQLPIYMATLGKAMGVSGAFVAGSDALIETLIQKARPYIYTTAMPPALAQALIMSIKISRKESWRREKLKQLIVQFRSGAEQLGLSLMNSMTPIQPVVVGSNEAALKISQALEAKGFLVTAIRPPTVPKGTARLRITLSAQHEEEQVEQLLAALDEVIKI